jgi:hypothetical protein
MPARHHPIIALLGLAPLLAACAHHVPLTAADRAALKEQPAIHVLHYQTGLPAVNAAAGSPVPAATEVRRAAGDDPAALVATSLGRLIEKKQKLANLHLDASPLPPPVVRNTTALKSRAHRGLALELWVDSWTFEPVTGAPGQFAMRWDGHARLTNPDNGRVLWMADPCRIAGAQNHDYRISARDLVTNVKLRKLLATARTDCARQLMRDFDKVSTDRHD